MNGTIGTVEVKVETSVMRRQAYDVERMAANLQQRFESIERYVNATKDHWIGEAGDLHRKLYENQKEQLSDALLRLKEHPRDLLVMAGIYEEAEKGNQEEIGTLREDVIV